MDIQKRQKTGPKPKGEGRTTRLKHWLEVEGFTSAALEDASGICRQSMAKIKAGKDVRLSTMIRILRGARALARRCVAIEELFDFEPEDLEPDGIKTT